jgi:hypothetical protein
MAINKRFDETKLSVVPTNPAAGAAIGAPVRVGAVVGVALTALGGGGNVATEQTVDFGVGVWELSVTDTVGGGIAVGDALFYQDGAPGIVDNLTTGYFMGFALAVVGAGLTATINVLKAPSPGAGTLGAGTIGTANLAAGIISADAAGRALMAANYFNAAQVLAAFAAGSLTEANLLSLIPADAVTNAVLLDAVLNGAFQADANTRALFADAIWTEAKLAAASLTGLVAANVADANVIGGLPVLFRINVAGGAAGNTDVVSTHKVRVIDAWAVHTAGAGEANDTIQVLSVAGGAITDAMAWSGADMVIVRAGQINDANHEVIAGDTIRVTTVDDDAGADVGAGVVYVLAVRVA